MKLITALAVLMFVAPAFAQDHAPTIEQCRADQLLWHSEFQKDRAAVTLDYDTLLRRAHEMYDCAKVDSAHKEVYENTGDGAGWAIGIRVNHFMSRHSQWDKFFEEDAAGAR
jgi:hypothetical protein